MPETSPLKSKGAVVLITGGSGFLGAALVRELLKESHESPIRAKDIRLFDIRPPDHIHDGRVQYISGDIRSLEALKKACRDVDIVFHAGALIDWGQRPRTLLYDVNVNGTNRVIAAAKASRVKALVYTSTMDVLYAGRPIINGDERAPLPKRYTMAYAETKALAEWAVLAANAPVHDTNGQKKTGSLRSCAIRPCCMFGEGDPYHVSSFLRMAQKRSK